jgi:cellobiose phosphorylase
VLGFEIEGGAAIRVKPCIPDDWPGFELTHRRADGTNYHLLLENPTRRAERMVSASLDGCTLGLDGDSVRVPLATDARRHEIRIVLGPAEETA